MPKEDKSKETLLELVSEKREAEEMAKILIELDLDSEDVEKQLEEIKKRLIKKVNSIDFVYINLDAQVERLKAYKELYQDEIKKITKKIESIEKNKDKLLQILADAGLVEANKPLRTQYHTYSLAKTYGSVEIIDETQIPKEYIKTKIEQVIDLAAIRADLLAGKEIPGVQLPVKMKVRRR